MLHMERQRVESKSRLIAAFIIMLAIPVSLASRVSASAEMPIGFFPTYNWGMRWVDSVMSADGMTAYAAQASTLPYVDNVWRSTDGGENFSELTSSPEGQWLAIDTSSDGQVVFGVYRTISKHAVALSTDGGETWSDSFNDLSRTISDVAISDDGQVVGVVFGTTSLFYSTNRGNSWDTSIVLPGIATRIDVSGDGSTVVAVGGNSAHTSVDGGVNWTTSIVTSLSTLISVSISENGNKVLAGSHQATDGDAWISNDGGSTFTPVGFSSEYGLSLQGVYSTMSSDGSTLLWAYYGGPLKMSRDGGTTWINPEGLQASWLAFSTNADGTRGFLSVEVGESKRFRRISPEIASVSPESAMSGESRLITIRGDYFYDGCVVLLGSTELSTEFVNSAKLRAYVPITLSGMFDLTVDCDGLSATRESAFNLRTTTTSSASTLPPTGSSDSNSVWFAGILISAGLVVMFKVRRITHSR